MGFANGTRCTPSIGRAAGTDRWPSADLNVRRAAGVLRGEEIVGAACRDQIARRNAEAALRSVSPAGSVCSGRAGRRVTSSLGIAVHLLSRLRKMVTPATAPIRPVEADHTIGAPNRLPRSVPITPNTAVTPPIANPSAVVLITSSHRHWPADNPLHSVPRFPARSTTTL